MKTLKIILFFTLVATIPVQSQVRFGVKGGVNISDARFNEAFDTEYMTGFNAGPVVEIMFARGGLGLDLALLYIQKGFEADNETVRNSYIQVPVNLKFKFGFPVINPYVAVGPYVDLRIGGDDVWDVKVNYQGVREQIKSRSFGAGLNIAAGVQFSGTLQVGLNYDWGLTDNYKSFDASSFGSYKGKSRTLSATAIIFF